ncbi:nucleoside monophosphate kinase [archaeon]|nr:nucleoside monophosphate kinase [archaeon]
MRLLILGPQGSGKGTQSVLIAKKYKIPHLNIGDILLEHIIKKDKIGKIVKPYYDKGKLVPYGIIELILEKRLKQKDCKKGFILDGYPRNSRQQKFLDKVINIDGVIFLNIPQNIVMFRLSQRRVCYNGHYYHLTLTPPKVKGICDIDGEKLIRREDDSPKAIKQRLSTYKNKTRPLIKIYKKRKILHEVDGSRKKALVWKDMRKTIDRIKKKK